MLKMFKKVAELTNRSPLQLGLSAIENMVIRITLSNQRGSSSANTLDKLLVLLQDHSTPFSNIRVDDFSRTSRERLYAGGGLYFPIIAGCRIAVSVIYEDKSEKPYVLAELFIPHFYRERVRDIISEINPTDLTLPRVYTFPRNEHFFHRTISSETFSGYLEPFYGEQKQLIDKEIYGKIDSILNRFTFDPDWYSRVGRQHRETFLIYGPPGTGKTNLIRHFSSKYGLNLVIAAPGRGLISVRNLLNRDLEGQKTIILIEDIDGFSSLCVETGEGKPAPPRYGQDDSSEYSDFLNFLDGVKPLSNVVVFMTTNFIDKIKDAIYRPGRVNHKIELSYPTFETILENIGFEEGDERLVYLRSLEMKQIPLDNIVSLRSSETLEEVKDIIKGRDLYFELSKASGDASSLGRGNEKETMADKPLEKCSAV